MREARENIHSPGGQFETSDLDHHQTNDTIYL